MIDEDLIPKNQMTFSHEENKSLLNEIIEKVVEENIEEEVVNDEKIEKDSNDFLNEIK